MDEQTTKQPEKKNYYTVLLYEEMAHGRKWVKADVFDEGNAPDELVGRVKAKDLDCLVLEIKTQKGIDLTRRVKAITLDHVEYYALADRLGMPKDSNTQAPVSGVALQMFEAKYNASLQQPTRPTSNDSQLYIR